MKRARWETDGPFRAIAAAAWPEDWATARGHGAPGRRSVARASMARRFEGYEVTRGLAEEKRRLEAEAASLQRRVDRLKIAIAALDFRLVQESIVRSVGP